MSSLSRKENASDNASSSLRQELQNGVIKAK